MEKGEVVFTGMEFVRSDWTTASKVFQKLMKEFSQREYTG